MLNYYNVSPLPLPPSLAEFESAGVDVSRSMVASCGSGVTAAHIAIAAHTLGSRYSNPSLM